MAHEKSTKKMPYSRYIKKDPNLRILIQNKNKARKIWQRTRNLDDKRIMKQAQKDLTKLIKVKNNENWNNYLSDLSPQDSSLWKISRKLKNTNNPIPHLNFLTLLILLSLTLTKQMP